MLKHRRAVSRLVLSFLLVSGLGLSLACGGGQGGSGGGPGNPPDPFPLQLDIYEEAAPSTSQLNLTWRGSFPVTCNKDGAYSATCTLELQSLSATEPHGALHWIALSRNTEDWISTSATESSDGSHSLVSFKMVRCGVAGTADRAIVKVQEQLKLESGQTEWITREELRVPAGMNAKVTLLPPLPPSGNQCTNECAPWKVYSGRTQVYNPRPPQSNGAQALPFDGFEMM